MTSFGPRPGLCGVVDMDERLPLSQPYGPKLDKIIVDVNVSKGADKVLIRRT